MMLKRTHPCEVHRGEHGQPGYCYVFPDGEHLGLQARRLAVWAAAMVSVVPGHMQPVTENTVGCR